MRLPGFFVVGAQKAGTTSLHEWLASQPDVCLPSIKETHFFRDREKFERGPAWYLDWFEDDEPRALLGEVDPDYLFFEEVPPRIRSLIERPRLVFVFRDPLERAYSHYRMSSRRGLETLAFAAALRAEPQRLASAERGAMIHHSYMARGRYAEQIERYRRVFPDSPMQCIDFQRLVDPQSGPGLYAELCNFLGIRSMPVAVDRLPASNAGGGSRSGRIRDLIYRPSALKRLARHVVRSERGRLALAQWLDRLNRRPEPPASGWRETLPRSFRDAASREAERLQQLSGLDLSGWPALRGH